MSLLFPFITLPKSDVIKTMGPMVQVNNLAVAELKTLGLHIYMRSTGARKLDNIRRWCCSILM